MPEETGYFLFDTNAAEVAQRIAGAMDAIRAEMLRGVEASGGLQPSRTALQPFVTSFETGLVNTNRQIQHLVANAGTGAQATARLTAELDKLVKGAPATATTPAVVGLRESVAASQQLLLRELLQAPPGLVRAMNLPELFRIQGRAAGANFFAEIRDAAASYPAEMAGINRQRLSGLVTQQLRGVGQLPLTLPEDATRLDAARLAAYKEAMAVSLARGNVEREFLAPSLLAEITSDPHLRKTFERAEPGSGRAAGQYRPALEALQALEREERAYVSVAQARERADLKAAEATDRLAQERQRLADYEAVRARGTRFGGYGELGGVYYKELAPGKGMQRIGAPGEAGVNPQLVAQAIAAQQAALTKMVVDAQRAAVAQNQILDYEEVARRGARFGAHGRIGDVYYRDLPAGRGMERIGAPGEAGVNQQLLDKALAAQQTSLARQVAVAEREAILENRRRNYELITQQGVEFNRTARLGKDYYELLPGQGAERITDQLKLNRAIREEAAWEAKVTAELERQQALTLRRTGPLSSAVATGFLGRGFGYQGPQPSFGEGIRNELVTLGTVGRYSGVYAVLSGLTGALADTAAQVLDFTDSLTDLRVAMRFEDVGSGLVSQLQQIAVLSGSNTGAALDAAARGVRAFGDQMAASGGDAADAGIAIARAATQIALITNKDLRDATGDVIAITSAFGLAADQASQVVDAISAAKDFGGDPANIAQGLANFATTAHEAGFTLGEAANALSLVIARTDQSGQAAATRLSRITSILAGTTGRRVIRELNAAGLRDAAGLEIDPTKLVKDQLLQIVQSYEDAAPEMQGRIRSALGGTNNLRELLPLLEPGQLERIIAAGADQSGRGLQETNRRATDLVGLLRRIRGDLRAIQVNLFQSGLFSGIAVALAGLEPALSVLSRTLDLFNRMTEQIPGLQTLIGILVDLKVALLALKVLGAIESASLLDFARGRRGGGGVAAGAAAAGTVADTAGASRVAASMNAAAVAAARHAVTTARADLAISGLALASARLGATFGAVDAAALASARAAYADAQAHLASARAAAAEAVVPDGLGRRGGLLGRQSGLLRVAGPTAAAAAVVGGAYAGFNAYDDLRELRSTRAAAGRGPARTDLIDPAALRALADTLRAKAADVRESQQGSLAGLFVKGRRDQLIEELHAQERLYRATANRLEQEDRFADVAEATGLRAAVAAGEMEKVAAALQELAESGADGVVQFDALIDSILKPAKQGRRPLPSDSPQAYANTFVQDFLALIPTAMTRRSATGKAIGQLRPRYVDIEDVTRRPELRPYLDLEKAMTPVTGKGLQTEVGALAPDLMAAARAEIEGWGLAAGEPPTDAQRRELVDLLLDKSGISHLQGEGRLLADQLREAMLGKAAADLEAAAKPPAKESLDPSVAARLASQVVANYEGAIADLPSSDIAGRRRRGRQSLRAIRIKLTQARRGATPGDKEDQEYIASIERTLARQQEAVTNDLIADMEALRQAQQMRAKSKAQVRAIGRRFFRREVAEAVEGGNLDALVEIFDRANQSLIDAAIRMLKLQLMAAQAELAAAQQAAATLAAVGAALAGSANAAEYTLAAIAAAQAVVDQAQAAADRAQANYDAAVAAGKRSSAPKKGGEMVTGPTGAPGTTTPAAAPAPAAAGVGADGLTAEEEKELAASAARRAVWAAKMGGDVAQARAQLENARQRLGMLKKGTTAYNEALADYINAQREYSDAVAAQRFTMMRANSDVTDELVQARIDTREARNQLRRDRKAGRGPGVIAEDKLTLRRAEANQERVAFDRRMHDAQVNEQLGKMSHQAYIRYLQNEHDRLTAIRGKSRQQIEMLQEVDLALKEATETMSGQFNLGDIKVPTPYEARRYAKAKAGGGNYLGGPRSESVVTTNNFTINGADMNEVRKLLKAIFGPQAAQRNTSGSRKS